MPRLMPTTLRPRFRAQARGGGLLRHVPNRPPRFPTSTPPPGPSARPSGFSIRSQQDSIGFNPTAFKAPVRTSVATEFNSGERRYYTTNPGAVTLRALGAGRLLASDSLPCLRKARCKTPVRHRFRGLLPFCLCLLASRQKGRRVEIGSPSWFCAVAHHAAQPPRASRPPLIAT